MVAADVMDSSALRLDALTLKQLGTGGAALPRREGAGGGDTDVVTDQGPASRGSTSPAETPLSAPLGGGVSGFLPYAASAPSKPCSVSSGSPALPDGADGAPADGADADATPAPCPASPPAQPQQQQQQQPDSQICFDFTKGMCTRGDKCKYSHDIATIVHFNSREKGICFDYLRNQCHRGLLCRFSHDLSNIAQQCQVYSGAPGAAAPSKSRSGSICYDFVKGVCSRGAECRYSHDLTLIARMARGSGGAGEGDQGQADVCFDFLRGRCTRGDACKYSHNTSILHSGAPVMAPALAAGLGVPGALGPMAGLADPAALQAAAAAGWPLQGLTPQTAAAAAAAAAAAYAAAGGIPGAAAGAPFGRVGMMGLGHDPLAAALAGQAAAAAAAGGGLGAPGLGAPRPFGAPGPLPGADPLQAAADPLALLLAVQQQQQAAAAAGLLGAGGVTSAPLMPPMAMPLGMGMGLAPPSAVDHLQTLLAPTPPADVAHLLGRGGAAGVPQQHPHGAAGPRPGAFMPPTGGFGAQRASSDGSLAGSAHDAAMLAASRGGAARSAPNDGMAALQAVAAAAQRGGAVLLPRASSALPGPAMPPGHLSRAHSAPIGPGVGGTTTLQQHLLSAKQQLSAAGGGSALPPLHSRPPSVPPGLPAGRPGAPAVPTLLGAIHSGSASTPLSPASSGSSPQAAAAAEFNVRRAPAAAQAGSGADHMACGSVHSQEGLGADGSDGDLEGLQAQDSNLLPLIQEIWSR